VDITYNAVFVLFTGFNFNTEIFQLTAY